MHTYIKSLLKMLLLIITIHTTTLSLQNTAGVCETRGGWSRITLVDVSSDYSNNMQIRYGWLKRLPE